jgi:hypothetical protein
MSTKSRSPRVVAVITASLTLGAFAAMAKDDIPRTASGKPDLSGTYDTATLTPLERPGAFGDRLYLTPEEAEAIEAEERELLARGLAPSDPNRAAPEAGGAPPVGFGDADRETLGAGNVGGYNSFWVSRGDTVLTMDGKIRTSILTEPATGRRPPMTPAGMGRLAGLFASFRPNDGTAWWLGQPGAGPYDDPERLPLSERCLLGFGTTQGPPMLPVLYNNFKRIVQTEDTVMILVEMIHDARIIRLNAEHGPSEMRQWLGDSVGRWEGDTLVVDTINFRDESGLYGASRDLHVIERFTRWDKDTLHYAFEVQDPGGWTGPWKGDYTWRHSDNKMFEYACHEGNYSMGGILRGARLLEEEARAAGK